MTKEFWRPCYCQKPNIYTHTGDTGTNMADTGSSTCLSEYVSTIYSTFYVKAVFFRLKKTVTKCSHRVWLYDYNSVYNTVLCVLLSFYNLSDITGLFGLKVWLNTEASFGLFTCAQGWIQPSAISEIRINIKWCSYTGTVN